MFDGLRRGLLIACCVAGAGEMAAASSFDFAGMANGGVFDSDLGSLTGFEGNWNTIDANGTAAVVGDAMRVHDAGVWVWATGSNSAGSPADAFFDARSGGLPGGLGVCSGICKSGGDGAVTDDDNAGAIGGVGGTGQETLSLRFSQPAALDDIRFRDDAHRRAGGLIDINGVLHTIANGRLDAASRAALGPLADWDFTFVDYARGGTAFYITAIVVAPIPLPASGLLLGGGLLAFGAVRRRRRAG